MHNLRTPAGDRVVIAKTAMPAQTQYRYAAWWAATLGRNPEIEIAGPCETKAALMIRLRYLKGKGEINAAH